MLTRGQAAISLPLKTCLIQQVTWLVVTKVRSKNFGLVTECCRNIYVSHIFLPIGQRCICHHSYYCLLDVLGLLTHVMFFIVECGITRFTCKMCIFNVRTSSLSPTEKSRAQSITHSLTHPAYLMPREPKLSLWKNSKTLKFYTK